MQKILLIQTAFIGDVVLATALIEKLRQRFPESKIDFLVRKGNEGLLTQHPHLHEILIWEKKHRKQINLFKLLFRIRKSKYDAVINVQRFSATGLLTALSGASHTVGFDKNPWGRLFSKRVAHVISTPNKPFHEIQRNQLLIEDITDSEPAKPTLYPTVTDYEHVRTFKSKPYIIIAPASVWFTKQYPFEKWVSFLNLLSPTLNVYIIGAPGDKDLGEKIKNGTQHPAVVN
ncbi:MAG: glycosyltransferase family 9 protein, partial [Chitinophagaceae bacterium]|nr:glycosyltransferase family 9 protein [Chitinophagaceae bacterium]